MNVLAISSSPRPNSNSRTLLDEIVRGIEKRGIHTVQYHDVAKMNIAPCKACNSCRGEKSPGVCVIKDDMAQVADAVRQADVVFMATPLYWWNISAQLKLVIDRLYALEGKDWKGKTIYLIVTGQSDTDDVGYKVILQSFNAICEYLNITLKSFIVSAHDETHPVAQNKMAMQEAYDIGFRL